MKQSPRRAPTTPRKIIRAIRLWLSGGKRTAARFGATTTAAAPLPHFPAPAAAAAPPPRETPAGLPTAGAANPAAPVPPPRRQVKLFGSLRPSQAGRRINGGCRQACDWDRTGGGAAKQHRSSLEGRAAALPELQGETPAGSC